MKTFIYFAYGSNMLYRRLQKRTPSATIAGTGFVDGRRLTFQKISTDGSGKYDLQKTNIATGRAYGVLYAIAYSEKGALDNAEGLGNGYKEENITVQKMDGSNIAAVAYVATAIDPTLQPYDWYKAFVVAGAMEHNLPQAYVEWIRTFHSQADPNIKRRTENGRMLLLTS